VTTVDLTPEQLAYCRAIRLIKMNLEPTCEGCGYGADRPNCAIQDGNCPRHQQENVDRYHEVIQALTRLGGLNKSEFSGWRHKLPLRDLYQFNEEELALLRDLADRGGEQATRIQDKRFSLLHEKGAVSLWADDRWHVKLTDRARDLLVSSPEEEKT
jgi:hypothetical protein